MGCSNSRETQTGLEEERIIGIAEAGLFYPLLTTQVIDRTVHRYSISNRLTEPQLIAAFTDLKITTTEYNRQDTPVGQFYDSFLNPDKHTYSARKLTSLGILLGQGNIKIKASSLFQNYDADLSKSIGYNEFYSMLEELMDIALVQLPKLALKMAADDEKFLLSKYIKRLQQVKPILTKYFIFLIYPEKTHELPYEEFLEKFKGIDIQSLVSAKELRGIATHHFNTVIAPSNLVKSYVLAEMSESKKLLDSTRGEDL